jgi:hypothetical protein
MRAIAIGRYAGILLGSALLVSCNFGPFAELAGEPGLFDEVKRYYESRAVEVAARCRTPELYTILKSEVLERSPDRLVIRVDYSFGDASEEYLNECRGFGAREFTAERRDGKFEVVQMSGIQNPKGIRIDRIDTENVW